MSYKIKKIWVGALGKRPTGGRGDCRCRVHGDFKQVHHREVRGFILHFGRSERRGQPHLRDTEVVKPCGGTTMDEGSSSGKSNERVGEAGLQESPLTAEKVLDTHGRHYPRGVGKILHCDSGGSGSKEG